MLTVEEVYALEQVTDKTWGRSSTAYSSNPQCALNVDIIEDCNLVFKYVTIVNMGHPGEMHQMTAQLEAEAMKMIEGCLKEVKADFKERAGRALKCKMVTSIPEVEYISMSAYNPKRTAYYRMTCVCECE